MNSRTRAPDQAPWFVLYVKPRHEKNVAAILRGRGQESFLPLYAHKTRARTTELPLFPGYVFCRFRPSTRKSVLSVPGVFSVVEFGGAPAAVEESEIEALQRVVELGLTREPFPSLPSGAGVTVKQGPMEGIRGVVIRQKNTLRVVISVTLLQRSVAVEVEREWLEKSSSPTLATMVA